jgi:hypothetical protein
MPPFLFVTFDVLPTGNGNARSQSKIHARRPFPASYGLNLRNPRLSRSELTSGRGVGCSGSTCRPYGAVKGRAATGFGNLLHIWLGYLDQETATLFRKTRRFPNWQS